MLGHEVKMKLRKFSEFIPSIPVVDVGMRGCGVRVWAVR